MLRDLLPLLCNSWRLTVTKITTKKNKKTTDFDHKAACYVITLVLF